MTSKGSESAKFKIECLLDEIEFMQRKVGTIEKN